MRLPKEILTWRGRLQRSTLATVRAMSLIALPLSHSPSDVASR